MTGDEMRDQLADVLSHWPIGSGYYGTNVGSDDAREMADALLPVVRKIAADELRALRARLAACEDAPTDAALEGLDFTLRVLAYQADALDPS